MIVFQEDLVAEPKCEIELSAEEVRAPRGSRLLTAKERGSERGLSVGQCHYGKERE